MSRLFLARHAVNGCSPCDVWLKAGGREAAGAAGSPRGLGAFNWRSRGFDRQLIGANGCLGAPAWGRLLERPWAADIKRAPLPFPRISRLPGSIWVSSTSRPLLIACRPSHFQTAGSGGLPVLQGGDQRRQHWVDRAASPGAPRRSRINQCEAVAARAGRLLGPRAARAQCPQLVLGRRQPAALTGPAAAASRRQRFRSRAARPFDFPCLPPAAVGLSRPQNAAKSLLEAE